MKTVFITGATRNTGLAIARHFAANGYNVALSSRSLDKAEKTAEAIEKDYSVKARGYALGLTDVSDIKRVFNEIEKDFGRLDVFVANSADLGIGYDLLTTEEEDYYNITDVNIKGTFFCCRYAAELMKKQNGGSIVTIGSVQSKGAVRGRTVYSMSKAALSSLVKNMAYELGEYGIRTNNVVAGAIHSERWDSLSEDELTKRRMRYPIGRESTEQEIANAVFYLGTDLSATVTGIDLVVDSGLSVCLLPYGKQNH